MTEIKISDEMVTAFRRAHALAPVPSTPDERVRAGLAEALAGQVLLPPGGEVSTQYTVIATDKDGRPMPGLLVHRALEAALRWKARLESDRTVRGFSLVIHQRSAYEWSGGPVREAYGPWSPVLSDNSTEEQA